MTNSWNGPQLGSPIRTDVPELQKKLIALLKQDPTSVANIPSGAKRLVNTSGTKWQVQQYNGSSWSAIGKLMHDVDKLDGYHAAITPAASTIAVRNADKKLEGDITGNAATASSATTLSETLPVAKGGTGATTSAAARTNLGVPPTSHASSSTTYGLGTDTNYGHVRSDSKTTKINAGEIVVKDVANGGDTEDLASGRGQIGRAFNVPESGVDFHSLIKSGCYWFTNTAIKNSTNKPPTNIGGFCVVLGAETAPYYYTKHIYYQFNVSDFFIEEKIDETSWSEWIKNIDSTSIATASIPGIVTSGDGTKIGINGELGVNETVVRTNDKQTINGEKSFTNIVYCKNPVPGFYCVETDYDRLVIPDKDKNSFDIITFDKNNIRTFGTYSEIKASGISSYGILVYQPGITNNNFSIVSACIDKNGKKWGEAPTPSSASNANHIATTEWVRNYTLPTGVLIPSLATSMTGYLLCNGAAVSRTTYANLFAVIGTAFGEGNGSTTFNLPDFRNRVFWGASGNLMSVIEAGLPDHTHNFYSPTGDKNYNGGYNANTWWGNTNDRKVVTSGVNETTIYGKSTTVQPPAIAVNIFIKY